MVSVPARSVRVLVTAYWYFLHSLIFKEVCCLSFLRLCNKLAQTRRLITTEMILTPFWRSEVQNQYPWVKPECSWGSTPCRGSGENRFCLWWPLASLGLWPHLFSLCLCGHIGSSSACVNSLPPSVTSER